MDHRISLQSQWQPKSMKQYLIVRMRLVLTILSGIKQYQKLWVSFSCNE